MRRVFEIFTENGWIRQSMVSSEQGGTGWEYTPTIQGMEDMPKVLKLLRAIDQDTSGETAACAMLVLLENEKALTEPLDEEEE